MICSYKVKLKDGKELFFATDELFSAYLAGEGAFLVQEYTISSVIEEGTNLITPEEVLKRASNRKRNKGGASSENLAEGNDLYRKMVEGVYEQIESSEIQWFKDTFADYPIVLKIVTQVINGNNWGHFTQDATYLYEAAAKGTAYHEAWHNFTQLFLSKEDKYRLYNEVRKVDNLDLTDKEIEEYLADKFMDYAISKGQTQPTQTIRKNIFQKIWDFIKGLFGVKTIDVDKLFLDLYSGNLNTYQYDKANTIWNGLNAAIKTKAGKEILSVEMANVIFNHFDAFVGDWLDDKNLYFSNLITKTNEDKIKIIKKLKVDLASNLQDIADYLQNKVESGSFTSQELLMLNKLLDFDEISNDLNTVIDKWLNSITSTPSKIEDEIENEEENQDEIDTEELTQEEKEEVDQRTGEFAQKSIIDIATKETKALVRTLAKLETNANGMPRRGSEGNLIFKRNSYGLTEPVNFSNMFNNLSFILADSLNYDEMVEKMKDPENQKKLPELALILERLKYKYSENDGVITYTDPTQINEFKRQLRAAFERDFNKSYVGVFDATLTMDANNQLVHYFSEETKQGTEYLKKKFFDQFMSLPKSKYVGKQEDERNYLTPAFEEVTNAFLTRSFKSTDDKFNALISVFKLLGITFSEQTLKSSEFKALASDGYRVNGFVENLQNRIKDKQIITEPLRDLNIKINDNYSLSGFFYDFLKVESKYNIETSSLTYLTAEGTKKYALMNPSLLFTTMNRIKGVTKNAVQELFSIPQFAYLSPENNESVKSSLVLNSLFNMNPESAAFGNRKKIGETKVEMEFGDYNGFKSDIDGKEIKKQTTSLSIREKIIMDMNNLLNKGVIDIMRTEASVSSYFFKLSHYIHKGTNGLFASVNIPFDFKTMFTNKNNFKVGMDEYFWNLYQFEKEDGFGIFTDITKGKEVTKEQLSQLMSDFFRGETVDFIKYSAKNGVFSEDGTIPSNFISRELKEKLEFAIGAEPKWSQLVYAFVVNDFIMNIEYSKLISGTPKYYKSYHKRAKIAISTGIPMSTSSFNKEHLERTQTRTMRFALTGQNWNVKLDTFTAKTVKDEIFKIRETLKESWKKALGAKFNEKKVSKYDKATPTDGQGRITLDGYREFRIRVGNWGLSEEATYIREVTEWKRRKGIKLTPQDLILLKTYEKEKSVPFGVIKAQYAGHVANVKGHKPVGHKFSLAPLIPSAIEGTPLDAFNDELLSKGVMYFTHESGSKIFKGEVAEFFEGDTISLEDKGNQEYYSQFLKEQLPTKSERKTESTWGSQMRKLFIANMFDKGVPEENFQKLYDDYVSLLEEIEENEKKKLYDDFGITDVDGKITITDIKPFIDTLLEQIEARDLNTNLKESIQYDEKSKSFKYPLEINLNRQDIINLVSGMIDKRLRRIHVSGDQLTMISPSGMLREGEELAFYEPIFDQYGNFVRTKPMEVKIGFSEEYYPLLNLIHPDGNKIETRNRLNEALRNISWREINEESVSIVGYRIPTQGPNSMDFAVIKEFLPETFYGIIVPKEYVIKTGADYDIDKIYIMRNVLNKAGLPTKRINEEEGLKSLGKINYLKHLMRRGFKEEMNNLDIARFDDYELDLQVLSRDANNFRLFRYEVTEYYKAQNYENLTQEIERLSLSIELLNDDIRTFKRKFSGFKEYSGIAIADIYQNLIKEKEETIKILKELKGDLYLKVDKNVRKDAKDKLQSYIEEIYSQDFINKLDYINQVRDPKNQMMNEVFSIYRNALSRPELFEQLITPNSSDVVKETAIYIGKLLALEGIENIESGEDIKNTQIFRSKNNYIKFKENLSGRNDLGAWAVNNTFSQLLQQAGVYLNKTFDHYYDVYQVNKETGATTKNLTYTKWTNSQMLLSQAEKEKIGLTVSTLLNAEDKLKQEIISELINSTVDIAADPFYSYLGINQDNKGPLIYLLQQGVPLKRAILFINHPVLRKYYQNRINTPFIEMMFGVIPSTTMFMKEGLNLDQFTKKTKMFAIVETLTKNKSFTEEELEKYIKRGDGRDEEVMAYFIKLTEQAKMFRNVQMTNSYDTTKFSTPLSAIKNKSMEQKVNRSEMFKNTEKIKNKSLVSVFDNRNTLITLFEKLFPYGYSKTMVDFYNNIDTSVFTKKDREKFERTVSADFIEFIIKNFAKVEGQTLGTYGMNLIKPVKGGKMLYETLIELNTSHPELKENFELFKKLLTNFETKGDMRKNVEILRGLDNTVDYQNLLIEEYKRLLNFTGNMLNKKVSNEEVVKIRKFMTDLAIVGFVQSGFNKSKFFFSDIIPNIVTDQMFTTALERFKNSGRTKQALTLFNKQFRQNNPEFFGYGKGQSYRGKNYGYSNVTPKRNLDIKDEECKTD